MEVNGVSANTVIHRHANIRKALQYAYKTDLIDSNPADKVQRPKKVRFESKPYNGKELEELFAAVKGTELELGVILAPSMVCAAARWWASNGTQSTLTTRSSPSGTL